VESGHLLEGGIAMSLNRLDEAEASTRKALALRSAFPPARGTLGLIYLQREDFAASRQIAEQLLKGPTPNVRAIGFVQLVYAALYQGKAGEAIKLLGRTLDDQVPRSSESAGVRSMIAELRLAQGRKAEALAEATRAIADANGRLSLLDALYQATMAGSRDARVEFTRITDTLPAGSDKYAPLLADAVVAIEAGRYAEALPLIGRFEAEAPPGPVAAGTLFPVRQPRTLADYWIARAQMGSGNDAEAAKRFTRVVDAGWARLFTPIEYIRSFYYLGQLAEKQGDRAKAREYYGRFLKYWKDGDIDRDKVADALKKIGS
jgi:tetratricopeptide (TPR) repeat protein